MFSPNSFLNEDFGQKLDELILITYAIPSRM